MRFAVFLYLYLGLAAHSTAQQQVFKIDYKFIGAGGPTSDTEIPLVLNPLSNKLGESSSSTPQNSHITVYVDEQFSQLNIDTFEAYTHIVDKVNRQSSILVPSIKQYITFDDSLALSEEGNDPTTDYQLQLVPDSSKIIAGYDCKLAIVDMDMGEYNANFIEVPQIKVWYAEDIPTVHWGAYTFLQELPGAALSITAENMGVLATAVKKVEKEAGLFDIPEDYTLLIDDQNMSDIPLGDNLFTYQDENTNLIGIWNEDQQIITPAKYTYISEFIGELAVVTNDVQQYGILQKNGQEFIPCSYESLMIDSESDLILFTEEGKTGVMDFQKKVLIPPTFAYLSSFSSGLATFSEGDKSGLINLNGDVIVPADYESIVEYTDKALIVIEQEQYYLVDIATKTKANKGYDYLSFANEVGLFVASENGKYGYVDEKGNVLIPFKYIYATPFYEGVASVNETENGETRYINTKGNYVQVDATE